MHLIVRRYSRSGYAPTAFYWLMAAGFGALAAWGIATGDWVVAGIAIAMAPVAIGGARVMRSLARAARESEDRLARGENGDE